MTSVLHIVVVNHRNRLFSITLTYWCYKETVLKSARRILTRYPNAVKSKKQNDTLKYVRRKSQLTAVSWKNKEICTHIYIPHFQSCQGEICGAVLNETFWFFTEHFRSLARLLAIPSRSTRQSPLMVRRCRAPQCRFVLACPWERDSRVSVCAGVFSPTVDHPSSVVTGSSLPHSPWPTSPVPTPPALIAPAAATCCKGSEEAEAEGVRGRRTLCVPAPSVNKTTFIFPWFTESYCIRQMTGPCYLPAATL